MRVGLTCLGYFTLRVEVFMGWSVDELKRLVTYGVCTTYVCSAPKVSCFLDTNRLRFLKLNYLPLPGTVVFGLYEYCCSWGLTINVNKNICDFKKRKQQHTFEWFICKEKLHIVKTDNLRSSVKVLTEEAPRASTGALTMVSLDIKIKPSLFDKLASPILS